MFCCFSVECARANESKQREGIEAKTSLTAKCEKLVIPDESTLSKLVAERLDLSISQCLLKKNFELPIIKKCWEKQLKIKRKLMNFQHSFIFYQIVFFLGEDFFSQCDLYIACLILQKQVDDINGDKKNIVVPSTQLKIQEQSSMLCFFPCINLIWLYVRSICT